MARARKQPLKGAAQLQTVTFCWLPSWRCRIAPASSGGACEIALNAREFLVITALNKRTFVAQLDFCTSPGRPPANSAAGKHAHGARLVITDRAIFDFGALQQELRLISVHPGQSVQQIRELVSWPLQMAAQVAETAVPSSAELLLLRTELDPRGLYR